MLRRRVPCLALPRSNFPLSSFSIRAYASDVAGLYKAIKDAKLDKITGLISLDKGYDWPTSTETGMQLVVRDCYEEMFKLARSLVKPLGGGGVVFTGNPGIGKSWFLNFALWKLLQEEKTVLFESVSQNRLWLFKDGSAELAQTTADIERLRNSERENNKAWYLFDPSGNSPREPMELKKLFTIVAASPNPRHFKQFVKRITLDNKRYVPCWSWEELQKFLPHAAATVAKGLTEDQALKHFKIFGGIPRYVYQTKAQGKATQTELDIAIRQLDLTALELVEHGIDSDATEENQTKLSHKLLQYDVSDDDEFRSDGVRFASNYVIEEVGKVKAKRNYAELVKSLQQKNGTVAGHLFQGLGSQVLTKGGRFRIYPLESSGEQRVPEWLTIPSRTKIHSVSAVSHLPHFRDVSADQYVMGAASFPVIDALTTEGGFNYTLSKRHGIAGRAGKKVLTALGVEKDNPLKMFWVVKDSEGRTFDKQTIQVKEKAGKGAPTPEETEIVEFVESRLSQYALEIPVVPYVNMTNKELEDLCEKKGLKKTGNKPHLISRLEGRED